MQIGMNFQEEPEVTASNSEIIMSLPFSISNGGFYDISELNVTTHVVAENGITISGSTSLISLIPKASTVDETHNISVSLTDILARNLTYLVFDDADLRVDMLVGLTYAHVIPLRILSNLTLPWRAPLGSLTIGETSATPPYNVPLSFENHAFFGLNGTTRLEIYDGSDNQIGSGTTDILVAPGDSYEDAIPVTITGDRSDIAEVHFYFNTSAYSVGPVVIPIE